MRPEMLNLLHRMSTKQEFAAQTTKESYNNTSKEWINDFYTNYDNKKGITPTIHFKGELK